MLHYDSFKNVTDQHRRHREGEAANERLALELRNLRQGRGRRWALPRLSRVLAAHRHAVPQ